MPLFKLWRNAFFADLVIAIVVILKYFDFLIKPGRRILTAFGEIVFRFERNTCQNSLPGAVQ